MINKPWSKFEWFEQNTKGIDVVIDTKIYETVDSMQNYSKNVQKTWCQKSDWQVV